MPESKSLEVLQHNLPRLLKQSERLGRPVLTLLIGQAYEHVVKASEIKMKSGDAGRQNCPE